MSKKPLSGRDMRDADRAEGGDGVAGVSTRRGERGEARRRSVGLLLAVGRTEGRAVWGQSVVEMALLLPLLILLLSVLVEAGLALNAWVRVNTAARDATRFALDAGRPPQVAELVRTKLAGIDFGSSRTITDSPNLDIYIITGTTGVSGTISVWSVRHIYDGDGGGPATPTVQRATIEQRLRSQGVQPSQNMPFVLVEVDFKYTPLLGTLLGRGTRLPMMSYAIIQQY